jgi:hypothetical protein
MKFAPATSSSQTSEKCKPCSPELGCALAAAPPLSDVPVSGWSLGPQRAARRAGSGECPWPAGCPYSPAYFLGRPPPPGNGLPVAFVPFLTKATFSRRFARQTRYPARADAAVPLPSRSATETSLKDNLMNRWQIKIFTRLWTTSWRKWTEGQPSKVHIWQALFVIRMLEAPFDFIGTSEIKVRP